MGKFSALKIVEELQLSFELLLENFSTRRFRATLEKKLTYEG